MSRKTLSIDDQLYRYLCSVAVREPSILKKLREETGRLAMANMQIGPEQGQFMQFMVGLTAAKRIIEVGTFTGYSSLAMALAMTGDGRIDCCDISDEWTTIARHYWQEAGVEDKIRLHLAPAAETLQGFIDSEQSGQYDLAFIDADKIGYKQYIELCYQLIRTGGLIMIDNTLWGGSVADPKDNTPDTLAIRQVNTDLFEDDRFDLSLVTIGDGLTMLRKL